MPLGKTYLLFSDSQHSVCTIHHFEAYSNHNTFDRGYINLTNVLSITHKHILQCSSDGQPQIINYISLLVAEMCFHLLHYPYWGTKFQSVCFTIVNDISKIYLCSYVHTNNSEQISFVINEFCYPEDCIFGCADM